MRSPRLNRRIWGRPGDEACLYGGEGSLLAVRLVHAGEGGRGERKSAGGETCPMRERASVGRGSLLAMRAVHAGEGERGERGVCWR